VEIANATCIKSESEVKIVASLTTSGFASLKPK